MEVSEHLYIAVKELTNWRMVAHLLREMETSETAQACMRAAQARIIHYEQITQTIMASPLMGGVIEPEE